MQSRLLQKADFLFYITDSGINKYVISVAAIKEKVLLLFCNSPFFKGYRL